MAALAVYHQALQQEVIEERLDNGLTIVIFPKPGFQQKYAVFATHYGGMDSVFIPPGQSEPLHVPDGIAHFLEHKLFDQPDETNVLQEFTRLGASPNAFTSQYMTAYHFTIVDCFEEGLDLLLDYVQTPYFTAESVEKEQGIIGQEIQMGLDDPNRMVTYNLLESLYKEHPARIRVIGSIESIRQITPEILYQCHDTFYHPSNMMLAVAGDVDPNAVIEQVKRDMAKRNYEPRPPIQRIIPDEPAGVIQSEVRHVLRVSRPSVLVGYKASLERPDDPDRLAYQRRLVAVDIALGALFNRHTEFYWDLYQDGTITDSFRFGYTPYPKTGHLAVGGETENPERLIEAITATLSRACSDGISVDAFEKQRKKEIGYFLSAIDHPASMANEFVLNRFFGFDYFAAWDMLNEVAVEEAQEALQQIIASNDRVVSIVEPMEGGA